MNVSQSIAVNTRLLTLSSFMLVHLSTYILTIHVSRTVISDVLTKVWQNLHVGRLHVCHDG